MKTGLLTRVETSDQGTFGVLETGDLVFHTLELPWRENHRGRSCVPHGRYLFRRIRSPKHDICYEEWDNPCTPEREDVKDRDNIQIHAANLAGDVDKGYVSQLLGCIAPGESIATFPANVAPAGGKAQKGVSGSRVALARFLKELDGDELQLTIVWKEGVLDKNPGSPGGY